MNDLRLRNRRRNRLAVFVAFSGLGLVGGLIAPNAASATPAGRPADAVQQRLDALVRNDGFPAALASVTRRDGSVRNHTAGVGDLKTRARVPVDGQVRIGSNTKSFTAVTVLQLVGEGKVDLDRPVETYLPGIVRGDGIDGRNITVRQILQHTSGLPSYTNTFGKGLLPLQHTYFEPRELLDRAFGQKATSRPGAKWEYSNTNYIVAGLIVEKVTGRPLREEITKRVVRRAGLRHTYFPNVGDQTIREPHPHGYHRDDPKAPLTDVTEEDPSQGWGAGQIVSTPSDVNRFFSALLGGRLLAPAQLAQMRTTVPAPMMGKGVRYGLGLTSTPLSCGGVAWGHGGDFPGYHTSNGATEDGRAATIAVTSLPNDPSQLGHMAADIDNALCH